MRKPLRMSKELRMRLETIAGMCNNYQPHEAGQELEGLLGYRIDSQGLPENDDKYEQNIDDTSCDTYKIRFGKD